MAKQELFWVTEKRKVSDLIPCDFNPRQLSEKQFNDLAKSLERFNVVEIPAIDADDTIIAGHQRVHVLEVLGRGDEDIDVRVPNRKLSEKEYKEYNLRSNKNTGSWDYDILLNEFEEAMLFDVGFTEDELAGFDVGEPMGGETDEDEVPEPPEEPKTKLGDIWKLGNHRLMCGDSTSVKMAEQLMRGEKFNTLITSPPYNQGNSEGDLFHYGKKDVKLYDGECSDNLSKGEYADFLNSIFSIAYLHKADIHTVVWNVSYNAKSRSDYGEIVFHPDNIFKVRETIVWDKGVSINLPMSGIYSRRCEFVFIMSECEPYNTSHKKGECRWNYWDIPKENQYDDGKIQHRATYPLKFADRAVNEFSNKSDVVLDLFGGTGTTLIACEKTKRKCRMMELDPKYCDVIINRWQDYTGKEAIRDDGKKWSEL